MSYYKNKGFWGGEKGHVHALQEFGLVAAFVGLLGWLLSPILGFTAGIYVLSKADDYWFNREVNQSINMGRKPTKTDYDKKFIAPSTFWTADGIADVKFPRKLRPIWALCTGAASASFFFLTGSGGLIVDMLMARLIS